MGGRGKSQNSAYSVMTNTDEKTALIRRAVWLEYLTLSWMVVEAAIGIGSGVAAGSLVLTAFGIDSLIELASACVLVWRLTVELQHGQRFAEGAEHLASRIGGALLFALAAYVVGSAAWKLGTGTGGEFSLYGLVLSVVAIPVMYFLSRRKLALASALDSRSLRTDAIESLTCGWLAFVVVVALAATWTVGAWWIDPVASLAIVWFLVQEAREAWADDECCDD